MNFLTIDCHVAVSADVRYIFNQLGHTVTEFSLSGYARMLGRPSANIQLLNGDNWCDTVTNKKFEEFFATYREKFEKFDGFIVGYPPVFAWLYKLWNKPIIMQMPIRYEIGVEHTAGLWEEFNEYVRNGIDSGKIQISANSLYDKKYAECFLNRQVEYIPSLCQYTGASYNPVYDIYLYYAHHIAQDTAGRMIKKQNALRVGHSWQTVTDFKGCIHYPYNISTMSTFEQYMANMPLFFPTKEYLMRLWKNKKSLTEISWRQQTPHLEPKSMIHGNFECDPNNYLDEESVRYWVDYSDFYCGSMKEIILFDNEEEIFCLSKDKLLEISNRMKEDNKLRIDTTYLKWKNVLERVKQWKMK